MSSLKLPLQIGKSGLVREADVRSSIDAVLALLIASPKFGCAADAEFGFVFNNLSFENFNETDGVVYNSTPDYEAYAEIAGLYNKKLSGSSKNLNTFASELCESIKRYERRLSQVTVSMTYIREEKNIYVVVKGVIDSTKEEYQFTNIIKIWN